MRNALYFIVPQYVCLRLVLQALAQHILDIGYRPALASLGKLLAHEGVEAHATSAEERVTVDDAVVKCAYLTLVEHFYRLLHIHGQEQMACQPVARTAGDDAKRRTGMHDGTRHLVHGAVAANGNDNVLTLVLGSGSNLRSVSGILRDDDFVVELLFVDSVFYQSGNRSLARCAGIQVDDENRFLLHIMLSNVSTE